VPAPGTSFVASRISLAASSAFSTLLHAMITRAPVHRNKTDNVYMYNVTLRHILQWVLHWKSNNYYVSTCACVRWVSGRVGVCTRVCVCSLAYPACKAYAPNCDVICGHLGSTIFFDIIS
jgi:hypothetical protein